MLSNLVYLLPVICIVLGGMVAFAAEPFLDDENKHKVLPWVSAFFVVLSAATLYYVKTEVLLGLYAMDPIRRMLCMAILLCALLGISGLQWTLGREKFKGGEAYGLMLLATGGAMLMTQAVDFVALFVAMELTSFPIYALVGIRRKDINANEGVFKYFVSGAIFSAIFLYGVSLIYGATGSTHFCGNLLDGRRVIYDLGTLLVVVGLFFKAGAAPMHFCCREGRRSCRPRLGLVGHSRDSFRIHCCMGSLRKGYDYESVFPVVLRGYRGRNPFHGDRCI